MEKIIDIRNEANSSIEAMRAEKIIGSSLEANIEIKLDEESYNLEKIMILQKYVLHRQQK